MFNFSWAVICEKILQDLSTGEPSCINIKNVFPTNQEISEQSPLALPEFIVSSLWENELNPPKKQNQYHVKCIIRDPSHKEIEGFESDHVTPDNLYNSLSFSFNKLVVKAAGRYSVEIQYKKVKNKKWNKATELGFHVLCVNN